MVLSVSKKSLLGMTVASSMIACSSGAMASELTFWSMWNEAEPQAQALQTIMDNYTAENPDTTFKAVWNGRQNQTKIRGALQAGTQIDLMDQDGDQLVGGLQKEGLLYALDGDLDQSVKDTFLPGTLEIYSTEGKIFQVPYIYNTVNFWYNKDMLAEAGASVPETWVDLIEMCKAVSAIGRDALVIESDAGDYNGLYFSHLIERALGSGMVVDVFEDKTGAGWSDPAILDAANKSAELWDAGCIPSDARGFQWPAGQTTVALEDTMGELVGSWLPIELLDTTGPDFPWGAFSFPTVEGGVGKSTDLQVALLSMAILKDSPNTAEAADFLTFLMNEESQKILVTEGGVGVTRNGIEWPAILADAYTSATNATALSNFGGGLGLVYPEFYSVVFKPEFNKMFLGQSTPEELIEALVTGTKDYWAANP